MKTTTQSFPGSEPEAPAVETIPETPKAEAESIPVPEASKRAVQAEEARTRAMQLMTEKRYAEAKSALEEADKLDAAPPRWKAESQRLLTVFRSKLPKKKEASSTAEIDAEVGAVDHSLETVSLYSKIAAAVGLLPGGLLNFGAILAVQVVMVWKIANKFGHREGKERIRGSILSLMGSAVPTLIGHGTGAALATIPAAIAGTLVYFIATPVLAYAMTQAVGNAFIMHFESGGTLLTFDAKAFGTYFLSEYQKAGGKLVPAMAEAKAS